MSAHDRYLANHSVEDVHVFCPECETDWEDRLESEYGASWLTVHEECPQCGNAGNLEFSDSDGPDEDAAYDAYIDSLFDR